MTTLFAIITFFFIFVLVYLMISAVLAMAGWWMTRRPAAQKGIEEVREIEGKIDAIKEKAFLIALVLTFFFVTPFVVLFVFVRPG